MATKATGRTRFFLLALSLAVAIACGSPHGREAGEARGRAGSGRHAGQAETAGNPGHSIKLVPHACVDRQGLGIEAFSLLMPAGWRFDGGIYWRMDNPAFPAYASCRVSNPSGFEVFEVFPNLPYFWTNNPMVTNMFPVGSKYFGNTVHPPMGAADALRQLVLPAFRGNVADLTVVSGGPVPELAGMVQQLQARAQPEAHIVADAAKVRVTYLAGGVPLEEEVYAVVQMFTFRMATMHGTVTNQNWWVDYIFSFRARKGQLDSAGKILQTIAFSFKVNPAWFAGYGNLVQYLIGRQIKQIHHLGEIGRIYAETGRQIREDQMRSWEANQAVRDRIADDWSRQFRGYDQYWDSSAGKMVELPSGYDNAWVNGLGEYVVSDSPSYNPNIGSNLHWQSLERR
jgi:hypothetical protein